MIDEAKELARVLGREIPETLSQEELEELICEMQHEYMDRCG